MSRGEMKQPATFASSGAGTGIGPSPLFLAPFQFLETRWRWPGRFGYLLTVVADKP